MSPEIPFTPIFAKILDAGGLFGGLFLIACWVAGILFRRLQASTAARIKEKEAWSEAQKATYEKRLEETARMTVALEKNAATSLSLISSSDARTIAFQEMVKGFAVLVEICKAQDAHFKDSLERVERNQEQMARDIAALLPAPRGAA